MSGQGPESTDQQAEVQDPEVYRVRFADLRRRRWMFFGTVGIYIPMIWGVKQVAPDRMFTAFGIWAAVMVVIMMYSALAVCPRCGNYFHMHGMTLLYLRKCLHCQLHMREGQRLPKE